MTLRVTIRTLSILAAAFGLSACQYSPGMADRSMAFNDAVANSNNQLLFRNIVRASERMPTYYSRLQGDTASAGMSPTLGAAIPFTKGFTFEGDKGATGVLTGTKSISSLGALSGTIGLSTPETNTLSLQTMDDQKYQAGMMKALDFTQLKGYFDEGYSRDLLMLMFIARVRLDTDLVNKIDAAVASTCSDTSTDSTCEYIRSDPYGANFAGGDWREHWSLVKCAANGGAYTNTAGTSVEFANDPAQEILPPGSSADRTKIPHHQMCFEMLLQDLFVLGLDIAPGGNLSSEVVDAHVPAKVANDPNFRLEMVKQGTKIVNLPDGKSAVLCRSKPDKVAFTLAFDRKQNTALAGLASKLTDDLEATRQSGADDDNSGACARNDKPRPEARKAHAAKADRAPGAQSDDTKPIRLVSKDIAFTERSFEGMIYYLGEIVRADESGVDPASIVRVHGRNSTVTGVGYTESMFYASSALDLADAALSIKADSGKEMRLPKLCPLSIRLAPLKADGGGCSVEYPDNESIAVLSLLNQVWGLQKEYTGPPAQPVILANPQ
ncbi:MAG: hypothetical protein KGJ49_01080 [Alphaproteobacteria bacterium]|nr:hypothetical protein [Alphaproteobacteria bacterium]